MRLAGGDIAGLDLAVARRLRIGHGRSALAGFARAWWADPFMKQAFFLVGLALVLHISLDKNATAIAIGGGPLLGSIAFVLIKTLPAIFAITAVRMAFASAEYQVGAGRGALRKG